MTQAVYLALLGYLAGLGVSLLLFGVGPRGDRSADGPARRRIPQPSWADPGDVRLLGMPGRARLTSADPANCSLMAKSPTMSDRFRYRPRILARDRRSPSPGPWARSWRSDAEGVSYWYGEGETRSQVLFDNTIEIGRGEVVIMTGPSGSGKTTLLTLIGALRRMQQGSLSVLEQRRLGPRRARAESSCGRTSASSSSTTTSSAR